MRATPAQARAIQRGAKYQHRVPVDPRITARPLRPASRHGGRPFHPRAGDLLTIHGGTTTDTGWERTDIAYATIQTAVRCPLGTLTPEDAKAEGYPTVAEFEVAFVEAHDRAWLDTQVGYLLEQGVPQDEAEETRDCWAKVRYDNRWASREVWLLTLLPFDDIPLLLPGLVEEPEAIPVERLRQRWTVKAAQRHHEAVAAEERRRKARTLARRVRQLALDGDPMAEQVRQLLDSSQEEAA